MVLYYGGDDMSKWHSLLEYFQFPLKVMFFAVVLLAVGSSIINPNIEFLWSTESESIIMVSEVLRYCGGFILDLFPLLVFIKVLTRKYEDSVPVFIGFVSIIIMTVTILLLEKTSFPEYFYHNFLGIQVSFASGSIFGEGARIPYHMGIITLLIAYFITTKCYKRSRHYSMHGVLSFIDHDANALITVIIASFAVGFLLVHIWPFIIQMTMGLYSFIANDTSNPFNLFIYGIMERLTAVFNMDEIPRSAFWLNSYGGSLTDSFGTIYKGDVNIWTAQQLLQMTQINAGRFITPYYVMNIFLMPAFIIAYYTLVSSKKDKRRYRIFILLAVAISIICGNPLPIELFILILSPMLYISYLIIVGLLYATFQILGVGIGYVMSGSLMTAMPGSILDLAKFVRDPAYTQTLTYIAIVGAICFVIFFFITRVYFKKFAIGLFSLSDKTRVTKKIVVGLGGIANIISVDSSPDKITIGLINRDLIEFDVLKEYGAYLILESRDGYLIRLGNISTIVCKEIKKMLNEKEKKEDLLIIKK